MTVIPIWNTNWNAWGRYCCCPNPLVTPIQACCSGDVFMMSETGELGVLAREDQTITTLRKNISSFEVVSSSTSVPAVGKGLGCCLNAASILVTDIDVNGTETKRYISINDVLNMLVAKTGYQTQCQNGGEYFYVSALTPSDSYPEGHIYHRSDMVNPIYSVTYPNRLSGHMLGWTNVFSRYTARNTDGTNPGVIWYEGREVYHGYVDLYYDPFDTSSVNGPNGEFFALVQTAGPYMANGVNYPDAGTGITTDFANHGNFTQFGTSSWWGEPGTDSSILDYGRIIYPSGRAIGNYLGYNFALFRNSLYPGDNDEYRVYWKTNIVKRYGSNVPGSLMQDPNSTCAYIQADGNIDLFYQDNVIDTLIGATRYYNIAVSGDYLFVKHVSTYEVRLYYKGTLISSYIGTSNTVFSACSVNDISSGGGFARVSERSPSDYYTKITLYFEGDIILEETEEGTTLTTNGPCGKNYTSVGRRLPIAFRDYYTHKVFYLSSQIYEGTIYRNYSGSLITGDEIISFSSFVTTTGSVDFTFVFISGVLVDTIPGLVTMVPCGDRQYYIQDDIITIYDVEYGKMKFNIKTLKRIDQ